MSSHEEHPVHSEPVMGHDGTNYEGTDARAGIIVWSLIIVAGLAAAGFALMVGVQRYFEVAHPPGEMASPLEPERIIPPAPQVQIHPWEDLPEMRAEEAKELAATGRDKAGRMHIPIENAINDVVPRLTIAPNAPRGIYTPGGQGREYSHPLTPAQGNERPEIQGEVRKNAQ
jgi:hypothetical protein